MPWVYVLPPFLSGGSSVNAQEDLKPQILVDQALVTLNNFVKQPNMEWLKSHLGDSKGVLIVPQLLKAGFVFGGSGAEVWCWCVIQKRASGASRVFTAWVP